MTAPSTDRFSPALAHLTQRIQDTFGSSPEDPTLLEDDPMTALIGRKYADVLDSVAEVEASRAHLRDLVARFTGDDPKEIRHIACVADRLAGETSRRNYHLQTAQAAATDRAAVKGHR
ncbi:hypothetical protein ACFS5L_02335 [Streptomyces phyllanthi]|uniref:Uncharacterized protein n=1 Tax=Streptomyces phyllanthi TaxID=1803180 RepID=A0A5N8VTC1_9ACTN|nr:hypothetical protein [Streptomyces phyllanthi]MPY38491.1 hypothetical protein [Streptomyces phyllanthi]